MFAVPMQLQGVLTRNIAFIASLTCQGRNDTSTLSAAAPNGPPFSGMGGTEPPRQPPESTAFSGRSLDAPISR